MPIRAFWSAQANVGRISAERDLRLVSVFAATEGEALKQIVETLRKEMDNPTVSIDKRRDVNATQTLKGAFRK